jgi:hypothetical protein
MVVSSVNTTDFGFLATALGRGLQGWGCCHLPWQQHRLQGKHLLSRWFHVPFCRGGFRLLSRTEKRGLCEAWTFTSAAISTYAAISTFAADSTVPTCSTVTTNSSPTSTTLASFACASDLCGGGCGEVPGDHCYLRGQSMLCRWIHMSLGGRYFQWLPNGQKV